MSRFCIDKKDEATAFDTVFIDLSILICLVDIS